VYFSDANEYFPPNFSGLSLLCRSKLYWLNRPALLAQSARGGSGAKFSLLAPHPFLADRPKWLSKRKFESSDFSQPCGKISSRSRVDLCPSLQGSLRGSLRVYFAESILARFDPAKILRKIGRTVHSKWRSLRCLSFCG